MGVVDVLEPVAPARAGGWKVDVSRGERNGRASFEWFKRPDDERYLSLDDFWANVKGRSERSRSRIVQTGDKGGGHYSQPQDTPALFRQSMSACDDHDSGRGKPRKPSPRMALVGINPALHKYAPIPCRGRRISRR